MAAADTTTTAVRERGTGPGDEPAPTAPARSSPLRGHRESILPAVAAALFTGKTVRTRAGAKGDTVPIPHPLVSEVLHSLPVDQRERWRGRCPEVELLSEHLFEAEAKRKGRTAKKPFAIAEARKTLRGAKITVRRIREDGDPAHNTYQPPCRSCRPLLQHFGVEAVDR